MFLQWIERLSDGIGLCGVSLVLLAYFTMQIGSLSPKGISFSLLNLVGSVFLLISLLYHWNFASVVIEVAWFFISLYGLKKACKRS